MGTEAPIFNNQHSPIIPWIGGKRRLAKHIIPMFPEHTCYVEPFAGAAALYFLKAPAKVEVLNDVNGELVNLYRVVKHHLEEFTRQFKWALTSRQMYKWLQDTPADPLTDIQRAALEPATSGRGFEPGASALVPNLHRASGLGDVHHQV